MNSIPYVPPEADTPVVLTRAQILEAAIANLEKELEEATTNWTTAKSTRDDVKIQAYEDEIVRITSSLSVLKMRRPV